MYQIQNVTNKILGYTGKRLPHATGIYSITELELLGLCVNVTQFKHLCAKVDFICTVDHLAFTYMMKSKPEPSTARIKRLEVLMACSFNLYYVKGRDMVWNDFLPE